jgi:hypothetical protein
MTQPTSWPTRPIAQFKMRIVFLRPLVPFSVVVCSWFLGKFYANPFSILGCNPQVADKENPNATNMVTLGQISSACHL